MDVTLQLYDGKEIPVLDTVDTCVQYGNQSKVLPLIVVGASLFGIAIFNSTGQKSTSYRKNLSVTSCSNAMRHFCEELGLLKGQAAKIVIPADTWLHFTIKFSSRWNMPAPG